MVINPTMRAYMLALLRERLDALLDEAPEAVIIRACIRSMEDND